eukprot:1156840-Pelagomonas_calceolata.AAC.7
MPADDTPPSLAFVVAMVEVSGGGGWACGRCEHACKRAHVRGCMCKVQGEFSINALLALAACK